MDRLGYGENTMTWLATDVRIYFPVSFYALPCCLSVRPSAGLLFGLISVCCRTVPNTTVHLLGFAVVNQSTGQWLIPQKACWAHEAHSEGQGPLASCVAGALGKALRHRRSQN